METRSQHFYWTRYQSPTRKPVDSLASPMWPSSIDWHPIRSLRWSVPVCWYRNKPTVMAEHFAQIALGEYWARVSRMPSFPITISAVDYVALPTRKGRKNADSTLYDLLLVMRQRKWQWGILGCIGVISPRWGYCTQWTEKAYNYHISIKHSINLLYSFKGVVQQRWHSELLFGDNPSLFRGQLILYNFEPSHFWPMTSSVSAPERCGIFINT